MTSGSVSEMKRLLKRNNKEKEQDDCKIQIREKEGRFSS